MKYNGMSYAWGNEDECSVTEWVTPVLTRINEV